MDQRRWLIPREDATGQEFSDADIARAHLIKDLKQDFGINDEGIGVILILSIRSTDYEGRYEIFFKRSGQNQLITRRE